MTAGSLFTAAFSELVKEDAVELYEDAPCGYLSTLPDGTIIKVNATFLEWTGHSRQALLGEKRFQELLPIAGRIFYDTHFSPLLLMQGYAQELAFEILCANGQRMPILLNSMLKRDAQGQPLVIRTTLLDARGRRAYEEELRIAKREAEEAQASLKRLNESLEERVAQRTQERDRIWKMSHDMLAVASVQGHFVSFNPAFTQTLGWTEEDLADVPFADLAHPDHLQALHETVARLASGQPVIRFEIPSRHKDGSYRWLSWTVMPEGDLLYAVGRDVTEEKRQADILQKTEEALRQSQKMEAIGKLTGGVAHDFNNILQVISGNLDLLKFQIEGQPGAESRLKSSAYAVSRGAKLAAQLLAFARRQPLSPSPTNLGRVVREMDDLLRRALGSTIDIEAIVGGGLWITLIDRNQLENVIINLAVNARDAMNGIGKLTIEVGNAMLDDRYAEMHAEVMPGQYVMLAVSDTGTGMTPEVMERAFEPFYTTKAVGEGTGLGLSMVYGFVKQSGGHIKIYSEAGQGTTFRIYLPRVHQAELAIPMTPPRLPAHGGTETILVVEDDPDVQDIAVSILRGLGYHVLTADNAKDGLRIIQSGVPVDLLFTDVVMPGPIRTPELAHQAKLLIPDIAVLFTSGYTQNAIVHGGRLDHGVELISKPYSRDDLAKKIRQLLSSRKRPAPIALPPQNMVTAEMSEKNSESLRILVVEDNQDACDMLCELLRFLGHEARAAENAEVASRKLEEYPFDILLTDVNLPGESGVELARRAVALRPALKIIFSSGHGAVTVEGLRSLSLSKPYDLAQIEEVLRQAGIDLVYWDRL